MDSQLNLRVLGLGLGFRSISEWEGPLESTGVQWSPYGISQSSGLSEWSGLLSGVDSTSKKGIFFYRRAPS
jgi:hypothetical protein